MANTEQEKDCFPGGCVQRRSWQKPSQLMAERSGSANSVREPTYGRGGDAAGALPPHADGPFLGQAQAGSLGKGSRILTWVVTLGHEMQRQKFETCVKNSSVAKNVEK